MLYSDCWKFLWVFAHPRKRYRTHNHLTYNRQPTACALRLPAVRIVAVVLCQTSLLKSAEFGLWRDWSRILRFLLCSLFLCIASCDMKNFGSLKYRNYLSERRRRVVPAVSSFSHLEMLARLYLAKDRKLWIASFELLLWRGYASDLVASALFSNVYSSSSPMTPISIIVS